MRWPDSDKIEKTPVPLPFFFNVKESFEMEGVKSAEGAEFAEKVTE